jgi:phospholipid/cholesterol/gamma-HCH transport system substrate-binding protein
VRPRSPLGLKYLQVEPGKHGKPLAPFATLPLSAAKTPVELTDVLNSLDAPTRSNLRGVLLSLGDGLAGRGADLRRVLRASAPTFAETRRVAQAVADRREKVKRLVSNLRELTRVAASKDRELASLVDASSAVFTTLAGRDADLQASVERLPGALHATRTALAATRGLALDAGPALVRLRPVARQLAPALVQARPLLRDATPVVRNRLRPLVRAATPLLASLRPSVDRIESVTPPLVDVAHVLNRAVNELGYNPPGSEEGFLYWLAWYIHNGNSVLTVEDAHGVAWRGLVMFGCSTIGDVLAANPALFPLASLPICPPPPPKSAAARRGPTLAQIAQLARKGGTAAELARSARAPGEPFGKPAKPRAGAAKPGSAAGKPGPAAATPSTGGAP